MLGENEKLKIKSEKNAKQQGLIDSKIQHITLLNSKESQDSNEPKINIVVVTPEATIKVFSKYDFIN